MQNRQKLQANNTSGHAGVSWDKRRERWHVQITVEGIITYLGSFANLDDAVAARKAGEQQHHPYRDPEYREPVAT